MSWSRQDGRVDITTATCAKPLIARPLELIAQKSAGLAPFAVSRDAWAGVFSGGPGAFPSPRANLLADVARRGFEQFAAALERAWDDGKPSRSPPFERVGNAYLEFAAPSHPTIRRCEAGA